MSTIVGCLGTLKLISISIYKIIIKENSCIIEYKMFYLLSVKVYKQIYFGLCCAVPVSAAMSGGGPAPTPPPPQA